MLVVMLTGPECSQCPKQAQKIREALDSIDKETMTVERYGDPVRYAEVSITSLQGREMASRFHVMAVPATFVFDDQGECVVPPMIGVQPKYKLVALFKSVQ